MKSILKRLGAVLVLVVLVLTLVATPVLADPASEPWPPRCNVVLPGK
ncbi:MAG TPA: hypothetical protein VGL40_04385 [Bacillota bacterium]|jgi:hypothetical protein